MYLLEELTACYTTDGNWLLATLNEWTGWAPLHGLTLASDKSVTVLHGLVFAVGSDNKLYTIKESSPGINQWTRPDSSGWDKNCNQRACHRT